VAIFTDREWHPGSERIARLEEIASGGYEVQAREIVTIPFLITCQKGYACDKSMRPDKKLG